MQEEGHTMTSTQCRNGNPWGGLSYADLITAAILSAKNKRMTLEEIYQWLVTNVSYFGDKRDDSSRVGWKVSTSFYLRKLRINCKSLIHPMMEKQPNFLQNIQEEN